MILRTLMSAVAVIAIPMAVVGAQQPAQKKSDYSNRRVCDVTTPMGSRLGGVRRCRTAAERDQHKQEARQVVDRIQLMKPTCAGNGRCPGG